MRRVIICGAFALMSPTGALADAYLVLPDGTGDFPTIQAAIDACQDGDTVLLSDGTFRGPGNRDLHYGGKALIVRSENGIPAACILDCEGSEGDPHRGVSFVENETSMSILKGITITNGWVGGSGWTGVGAGVFCENSAPTIEECVFRNNAARGGGGAACHFIGNATFVRCTFEGNEAYYASAGGGFYCYTSAPVLIGCVFIANVPNGLYSNGGCWLTLRECEFSGHSRYGFGCDDGNFFLDTCWFHENSGPGLRSIGGIMEMSSCAFWNNHAAEGSAMYLDRDFAGTIVDCLIYDNTADSGGTIRCGTSSPTFANCTITRNSGGSTASGIDCGSGTVAFQNTIIAFNQGGRAISGNAALSCCDIFGNPGGDWVGDIADQYGVNGNISGDPLFCDPEQSDFTLDADSPCAPFSPPNPECDLIGSESVACGGPTACEDEHGRETTWGGMKALFRGDAK